jgi:hypothetical protein
LGQRYAVVFVKVLEHPDVSQKIWVTGHWGFLSGAGLKKHQHYNPALESGCAQVWRAARELCDETIVAIALAKEVASECAIKNAIDPIVSDGFVPPS